MALREILIHPDPRLKKMCEPVETVDSTVRRLAEDMLETMYDAPGVGLAAPQVGINSRLLVMDCADRENGDLRPIALINPQIAWASEEEAVYEEGCLSIPEVFEDIKRPKAVTVTWTDLDGNLAEETFEGLWATCVQHEVDHLNGKLFIDYLSTVKRTMITAKMKKFKKERARTA